MSQDYRCEKLGVSWRARHAGARRPSRVRRPCRPGSTRRHRTACPEHSRHRARRYVGKRTLPPRGSPAERRGSRSSLTRWSAGASAHGQGRSTGRWSGTRRKAPAPCSDRGARPRTSLRRRQPHRLFETESRRRARPESVQAPCPTNPAGKPHVGTQEPYPFREGRILNRVLDDVRAVHPWRPGSRCPSEARGTVAGRFR
jgi:hypothetical protein